MNQHFKTYSQLGMIVTKVANGWLLELPRQNDATGAMQSMVEFVKGIHEDKALRPVDVPFPGLIHVPDLQDMDIYVFLSFKELLGFMDIHFNQVNE